MQIDIKFADGNEQRVEVTPRARFDYEKQFLRSWEDRGTDGTLEWLVFAAHNVLTHRHGYTGTLDELLDSIDSIGRVQLIERELFDQFEKQGVDLDPLNGVSMEIVEPAPDSDGDPTTESVGATDAVPIGDTPDLQQANSPT